MNPPRYLVVKDISGRGRTRPIEAYGNKYSEVRKLANEVGGEVYLLYDDQDRQLAKDGETQMSVRLSEENAKLREAIQTAREKIKAVSETLEILDNR